MSKTSLLSTAIVSVLGLAALASLSASAPAQTPGVASRAVEDAIDPPIDRCPEILDTNANAVSPPEHPVATQIDARLLTAGLPCAETVSTKGLTDDSLVNLQRGFDFYSWQTFVALNSPADGTPINQKGRDPQTVWENSNNYRQLADIMMSEGQPPAWGPPVIPPECRSQFKPGMMTMHMVEEAFNQPFKTGPLIDQNGNYAVFDILLNKPMFDYILAHKLYSQKGQIEFNDPVVFPSGKNPGKDGPGRMGAIMLKVSWRVLANNDDRRRFHTARALIYMPGTKDGQVKPTCSGPKTLGLIGFHVAHKTVSRLQWIWTTFEHVDNAPEQKEVDDHIANAKNPLKVHYNFYNPTCNATRCPVNQTPPRPWGPDSSLKFHNPFRSQITRAISLFPDARALNNAFQSTLADTVWRNYALISTQWPSDFQCARDAQAAERSDPTCAPAPTYLANTTLETYSQGAIPLASSSCMACHGNATSQNRHAGASDFTFTLEKAQ